MFEISVDDKGIVKVSGALGMDCVEMLHSELKNILDNGSCTALDFIGVTEISTAALQVIVAFRKAIAESGRLIGCTRSPVLQEAAELSGIGRMFKAS